MTVREIYSPTKRNWQPITLSIDMKNKKLVSSLLQKCFHYNGIVVQYQYYFYMPMMGFYLRTILPRIMHMGGDLSHCALVTCRPILPHICVCESVQRWFG